MDRGGRGGVCRWRRREKSRDKLRTVSGLPEDRVSGFAHVKEKLRKTSW